MLFRSKWEMNYYDRPTHFEYPIMVLLRNLLLELYVSYHTKLPNPKKSHCIRMDFDSLLLTAKDYLEKNRHKDETNTLYFENALNEINDLHRILETLSIRHNPLPESDSAYYSRISLPKTNLKTFKEYTSFIDQCARQPFSFILKYLDGGIQTQ